MLAAVNVSLPAGAYDAEGTAVAEFLQPRCAETACAAAGDDGRDCARRSAHAPHPLLPVPGPAPAPSPDLSFFPLSSPIRQRRTHIHPAPPIALILLPHLRL